MTRPTEADHADDLLRHIAQGPGLNPDAWVGTYHRLKRNAPEVQNDRPAAAWGAKIPCSAAGPSPGGYYLRVFSPAREI